MSIDPSNLPDPNANPGTPTPSEQTVAPATVPAPTDPAAQDPASFPTDAGTGASASGADVASASDAARPAPTSPQDMFSGVEPVRGPDTALLSTDGPNWGPRSTSAPTIDPTNIPDSHLRLPSQFGHPDDLAVTHDLGCPVCGNNLFIVGAADFATGGPSEPRPLASQWIAHSTCDACGARLEFVFQPTDIRIHPEPLTFAAVAEHATRQVEIQAAEDAVRVASARDGRARKEQLVRDLTSSPAEGTALNRAVR